MAAMVVGLAASPAAAARGGKGNGNGKVNGKVNEQQQRASDTTDTTESGSGDAETTDGTDPAATDVGEATESGSGNTGTTDTTETGEPYDAATALGSLYHVVDQINARTLWKAGITGDGVDVSQVIAGIDWVIEHRTAGDLDIRVINLSYGTDSTQDYRIDPLARAVERAWEAGIVAASGNDGWPTPPAA
jgi:hypothetical protein